MRVHAGSLKGKPLQSPVTMVLKRPAGQVDSERTRVATPGFSNDFESFLGLPISDRTYRCLFGVGEIDRD